MRLNKFEIDNLIKDNALLKERVKELKLEKQALKEQLTLTDVSHCFCNKELNYIRQWFNTTIDSNRDKDIKKTEWKLGLKIHNKLKIKPEKRIVKNCG